MSILGARGLTSRKAANNWSEEWFLMTLLGWAAWAATGDPWWTLPGLAGALGLLWQWLPDDPDAEMKALFRRIGLVDERGRPPLVIRERYLGSGREYILTSPPGLSSASWEKHNQELSEALGGRVEAVYRDRRIIMRVYRWGNEDRYEYQRPALKGLTLPIGYSRDGLVTLNLGDQWANLLVGGITGSGKSSFLRQALVTLILNLAPDELVIHLVDLKRVEFAPFRDAQHVADVATNPGQTLDLLSGLEETMCERYRLFDHLGVVSLADYNRRRPRLPWHLTIIDEYADLRGDRPCQDKLDRLLRQGRAVGLHHLVCTQRPDIVGGTMSGSIRANLAASLAFGCRDKTNSVIILGNDAAADIHAPGQGILQTDRDREIQVMWLSVDQAKKLIKPFCRPKPRPKERGAVLGEVSLAELTRQEDHRVPR
jgi:hypothetical protein